MDEALVIKIFYFVIALFSVSMVFLMLQTPYSANIYKNELKVANMQASNVVSYELNSTLVYGRYEASDVTRYETYDLLNSFSGLFLRGDYTHSLSSKLAILKDDNITLKNSAIHRNLITGLRYDSEEIVYDSKAKIINSNVPFKITQNADTIVGQSVIYDMMDNTIYAQKVKGWFYEK